MENITKAKQQVKQQGTEKSNGLGKLTRLKHGGIGSVEWKQMEIWGKARDQLHKS